MHEFYRIIDEQANHVRDRLADLLDQGRIETGTVSLAPEPAEVAGLVEQARRTFQGGGGTHALSIDLPDGLPRVMADPGRIAQVLNNLFSNAARHSPESSPIRVVAERDGVHVAVSVSDNEGTSSFSIGDASVTEGGLGDGGPRVHGDAVAGGGHGDDGGLGDEHGAGRHGDGGHRLHRGQRHPQLREGGHLEDGDGTVTGDELDEANETLTVKLSSASDGLSIGDATATGTITDDDDRGLVFSPTSVTVTEASGTGRTATYRVALSSQPTGAVSVSVATADSTAATVLPATVSFTTSNWKTGQTVTVTGVDDTLDNTPDRTTEIGHTASGGDYASISGKVSVTVTDDESSSSFSIRDASVTEGESGTASLTFTVTLSPGAGHGDDGGVGDEHGAGRYGDGRRGRAYRDLSMAAIGDRAPPSAARSARALRAPTSPPPAQQREHEREDPGPRQGRHRRQAVHLVAGVIVERVIAESHRQGASLRSAPASRGSRPLTTAPRTLVQTGSYRTMPNLDPLHVVVDDLSRICPFSMPVDTPAS